MGGLRAENFVIGRLAGADGGEERSPGVRHAAADSVEVEANAARFAQQSAGEVVAMINGLTGAFVRFKDGKPVTAK